MRAWKLTVWEPEDRASGMANGVKVHAVNPVGLRLRRSSVSRLLNKLGLSTQRLLWRAYQQDPEVLEK